jgi:hypothetical protein
LFYVNARRQVTIPGELAVNVANEKQVASERNEPHSLPLHPLKGGVDKCRGANEAKVPFSAGKRGISEVGAREFFNQQERLDTDLEQAGLPDGSRLGLPAAAGFEQASGKPAVGRECPNPGREYPGRGRPSLFTDALVEKLCLMLSLGFSRNQAAAYLKIDKSSISRAAARDPDLAAELARAEELSDLQPQITLMAEAQKNWRAAAWYLEFRQRHPLLLSEEGKEAQHQAELAERRRTAELADATPRRRKKVRGADVG